jgi:hypothetical protein
MESAVFGDSQASVHRVARRRQDCQIRKERLLLSSHAPPLRLHRLLPAVQWARVHSDFA